MARFHMIAVAAVAALAGVASAQQVFSTNFEAGAPAEFSGAGAVEGTQGYASYGFGQQFLLNNTLGSPSILTLTNLPAHTAINIDLLLAAIDSWDSDNGNPAPDYFNISVDNVSVFQATFANTSGSNSYGPLLVDNANLGFSSYLDDAADLSAEPALHNIPHTASTVVIQFYASGAGWQGGFDESWAIDNVAVSVVPAPGAAAVGLLGLAALRRRR
jgi:uncharacterized protein (TIGR03382 family)